MWLGTVSAESNFFSAWNASPSNTTTDTSTFSENMAAIQKDVIDIYTPAGYSI